MASDGKVISFINMKGGVGKTTLSMGIADYLAEQNKKTLFIDIDPNLMVLRVCSITTKGKKLLVLFLKKKK